MRSDNSKKNEGSGKLVFCRYIRKNGKTIYPKNGQFFRFWIPEKTT